MMKTGRFKFSKKSRLSVRAEFLRFFDGSRRFRFGELQCYRIENAQPKARLGITLKSKMPSVIRNQVKRTIREQFRVVAEQLSGFDYNVVIPANRKVDSKQSVDGIKRDFRGVLEQLTRDGVGRVGA